MSHNQAEEKFFEAEQKYRSLVEQIPGVVYLSAINTTAKVAYISPQLQQLLGIAPEDWNHNFFNSSFDSTHRDDRDRLWQAVNTTISTGEPLNIEYRMIRHDGTIIWVRNQANLIVSVDGQSQVLQGLVFDISQGKQVEPALQESEARYLGILEDQTELIARGLPNGTVTFVNEAFCQFFGLKRDEILSHHYEPIVFEEDRERVLSVINSISLENPVVTIENRVIACQEVRWTQWIIRGIFDDYGTLVELQSVGRDISEWQAALHERDKAEEALRSSQDFLQKIANTVPHILYLFDLLQGTSIYLNQQSVIILGYSPEEICQADPQWLMNCFHPDDQHLWHDLPSRFANLKDNEVVSSEYRFRHKNGEWRWLNTREVVFARDASGTPTQILGSVEDINTRKQAERILRQQAEGERLISEVTQQIRQSLKLEEVLNTTVDSIRECLGSDSVAIYQLESDGSGKFAAESVGDDYPQRLELTMHPFSIQEDFSRYYKGLPIVRHDIQESDFSAELFELLQLYQIKAAIVVPILNGEHLWGLLIAHQCAAPRYWQAFEVNLLQQLAIQVAIAIHQSLLYQQLQAANEELQRLATLDGLTQIANRRRFDQYLDAEWHRLKREKLSLSLILFDVDFFKRYNDTYGHLAGDDCLRKMASAVLNIVKRPADLLARYGGEEFAVILPNTEIQGVIYLAEAIRQTVRDLEIPHAQSSVSECVTVSLGVVSVVPNSEMSPQDLINTADKALYTAKQDGRDRVRAVCCSRL